MASSIIAATYWNSPAFRATAQAALALPIESTNRHYCADADVEFSKRVFDISLGVLLQYWLEAGLGLQHQKSLLKAAYDAVGQRLIPPSSISMAQRANNSRHRRWCRQRWTQRRVQVPLASDPQQLFLDDLIPQTGQVGHQLAQLSPENWLFYLV